jgi:hypothetical protein
MRRICDLQSVQLLNSISLWLHPACCSWLREAATPLVPKFACTVSTHKHKVSGTSYWEQEAGSLSLHSSKLDGRWGAPPARCKSQTACVGRADTTTRHQMPSRHLRHHASGTARPGSSHAGRFPLSSVISSTLTTGVRLAPSARLVSCGEIPSPLSSAISSTFTTGVRSAPRPRHTKATKPINLTAAAICHTLPLLCLA